MLLHPENTLENKLKKIKEKLMSFLYDTDSNLQIITCYFCFETFEIDLGIDETFSGKNTEIFDCEICCNPNKVDTDIYDGEVSSLTVSDGNE